MKFLFLFLDGVGLGSDDPSINPLARVSLPNLQGLLGGRKLVLGSTPVTTEDATLLALDACLGVPGLPQSATGQASLLTGINVPAKLGYHYGPKPNQDVARFLSNGNLFSLLREKGLQVDFLNAYPPGYFEAIHSGRRIYSSIPLAATHSGLRLKESVDLYNGMALSADFTGRGWHDHLGLPETPLLSLAQAGQQLGRLALANDFSFFEYWLSDYAGHRQDMQAACQLLEDFDKMLGGLLRNWDRQQGLILITSDHGNLEDLSTRRHTSNPVPGLLIGAPELRRRFISSAESLHNLVGVAPAVQCFLANAAGAVS